MPPPEPEAVEQPCEAFDEEAEAFVNDIDSEDLDIEMIEALEKVLKGSAEKQQRLQEIRKMCGKEQRQALRGILKALTPAQLEQLVDSSSSESEDERKSRATKKTAAKAPPAVQLGPAQIECASGHALTAYSARPPDYKRFDGDQYTCDVCGRDGWYKHGVYHCAKCFAQGGKQYDACPSCGAGAGSSAKGNKNNAKKQKNQKKAR